MRRTGLLLVSGVIASLLACDGDTLPLQGDSQASNVGGEATGGTKCLDGTFNDAPQARWCTDCLRCGSLEQLAACTKTRDTECAHLGVGRGTGQPDALDEQYVEVARDLAVDQSGNVWLVGDASDALTGLSVGAFLRKYPTDGSSASFELFGSDGQDIAIAIAPSGTIWVAGTTTDDLGGPAQGETDVYVRRYEPGSAQPITDHFGTSSAEHVADIITDAAGNAWVVGDTAGDLVGARNASSALFLRVYSPAGDATTGQFGGPGDQRAFGVAVDGAGNVWIAEEISQFDGSVDAAVLKLPADGTTATTDRLGSAAIANPSMGIAVDSAGNAWVAAAVEESALIRKYPADGSAPVTELIANAAPRGVAVDNDGNAWVVGEAYCNVADDYLYDPLRDLNICSAQGPGLGQSDSFIRQYPADGATPSNYQFGTRSVDRLSAVTPGIDYGVWVLGIRSQWQESIWHVSP
ncbi:MAG TPA: hypothetical protein VEQ58_13080 [Polyangiaceae bacterium]|nr:hypothetical protein [Polyangiaceae bacterium]